MQRVAVPLPIQTAKADARSWSQQALINAYIEAAEGGAASAARVRKPYGFTTFCDTGMNAGVRGMGILLGVAYAVVHSRLYKVADDGTSAIVGTGISGDGPVSVINNRTELCIVTSEGDGYVYTVAADSFEKIADVDGDWLPAIQAAAFDDRGVFVRKDSEEYFISELSTFKSFNALEFASAEKQPDELVSVVADHGELWLFGAETTEVWYNAGATDFPFARIDGGVIERGCAATFGVAKEDNTVFWIGEDRTIYRARGYQPQRISTHAIEEELQAMATVADCEAIAWTESGHKFVAFSFPTAKRTFVFDAATSRWHERRSGVGELGTVWRARCVVEAYGETLFGDRTTGKIYKLDENAYDEAGAVMQWSVTTLPLRDGGRRVRFAGLDAHFDMGRGLTSGQGDPPEVMLQVSNDGGYTFGVELVRSLGAKGEYGKRVRWNRLGSARDRVFRLSVTDPVPVTLMELHADMERGAA